jgi:choline-glycine betaine transporter
MEKKKLWVFLIAIMATFGLLVGLISFYPETPVYIAIALVFVFFVLCVVALLYKRKKPEEEHQPISEREIRMPKMSNLIFKCECGFLLTSSMKKCPQCGREVHRF